MPAAPLRDNQPCPCGQVEPTSKTGVKTYANCCGRFVEHFEDAAAPDAEHLMRSRYSAFVHAHAAYLLNTWHSSTRPESLTFEPDVKWLGLQVRSHQITSDNTAEVEFVARYRVAGKAVRLHERSRFVREAGRWLYVDGDMIA